MKTNCRIESVISALATVLLAQTVQLTYTIPAFSAPQPPQFSTGVSSSKTGSFSLNLGSSKQSTTATNLGSGQSVAIKVGGTSLLVNSATSLTPAERAAVMQVLQTGHQSLILAANGAATGGSMLQPA